MISSPWAWFVNMRSDWPNAVVICVDVIRPVDLSIVQAGAQVGRHTLSRVAQVLPSRAKAALLTHPLPLTACLRPRQSAARPVTHTPTGLIHLTSSALKRWGDQNKGGLGIHSQLGCKKMVIFFIVCHDCCCALNSTNIKIDRCLCGADALRSCVTHINKLQFIINRNKC